MRAPLFFTVLFCGICNLILAQEAKYELKSAIIEKEVEVLLFEMKMDVECYIDDYGEKEVMYSTIELPDGTGFERNMSIVQGDMIITVSLENKTANISPLPAPTINYLHLTPEIIEIYNLQEIGEETFLGKPCKIYSLQTEEMEDGIAKVWIWKGIQLKSESTMQGITIATERTTKIQENVSIPADTFQIPDGIEFE